MIKQIIDDDIKTAMLSGDKELVNILRTVKSVILDAEVNQGLRDTGLPEDKVIALLQKEQKKRNEAATLYTEAGDQDRARKEAHESEVIAKYLPAMMSEDDLKLVVRDVIASFDELSMQQMGQVIGSVKAKVGNLADGGVIAAIVKSEIANRLNQ